MNTRRIFLRKAAALLPAGASLAALPFSRDSVADEVGSGAAAPAPVFLEQAELAFVDAAAPG